jgi:hypothetical protein
VTGGIEARFRFSNGDGVASRALFAPTCEDALEALAFALPFALEGVAPASLLLPQPSVRIATGSVKPVTPAWPLEAGILGGVLAGPLPAPVPVFRAHVEFESALPGVVSPSLGLSGAFVVPSTTQPRGVASPELAYALQTGAISACPLRIDALPSRGRAPLVSLRPCVELQLGRLQARSAGVAGATLQSELWAAVGLSLQGRVSLGRRLSLEIAALGGMPLQRYVFRYDNTAVFAQSGALFSLTIGPAVHFP